MSTGIPVLVGAGSIPELSMRQAAEALGRHWQLPLTIAGIGDQPSEVLSRQSRTLIRLVGDPARQRSEGGHWLDALADWRRPLLLLVKGNSDGSVSGCAAAYTALCQQLHAPLEGVIQIQGTWDSRQRRRDGLPWCGWIPDTNAGETGEQLDRLTLCLSATTRDRLLRGEATAATPPPA